MVALVPHGAHSAPRRSTDLLWKGSMGSICTMRPRYAVYITNGSARSTFCKLPDHPAGRQGGHILPRPGCADSQVTGQDSPWHVPLHLGTLASAHCPTDAADGFTVSSSTCPRPRGPREPAADSGAGRGAALGGPEVHSTGEP